MTCPPLSGPWGRHSGQMKNYLCLFGLFLLTLTSLSQAKEPLQTIIQKLDGTSSYTDGPNCWNGAMYAAGVVQNLRMFHPDEWLYHLRENCTEVNTPSYGDVGRIYSDAGEVHGFIYLNGEQIFAKHGEQTQWGYRLMPTSEMLSSYERTRDCRIAGDYSEACFHLIKYYHCEGESKEAATLMPLSHILERLTFEEGLRPRLKMTCEGEVFLTRNALLKDFYQSTDLLLGVSDEYRGLVISSYLESLSRIQIAHRQFRCSDRMARDQNLRNLRERLKSLQD